jgi:hypothetical protein
MIKRGIRALVGVSVGGVAIQQASNIAHPLGPAIGTIAAAKLLNLKKRRRK